MHRWWRTTAFITPHTLGAICCFVFICVSSVFLFSLISYYLGTVTFPALSNEPSVNQSELASVKSLMYCLTDGNWWMVRQPDFVHRWTENKTKDTAKKMAPTAAQTSVANGDMNDRMPGFCFIGFLIIMLIPSSMNGELKSTTLSRAEVIVIPPNPTSASFDVTISKNPQTA